MADKNLKIVNVIVCDDVREEVRNKKSLMGTVSGDFLVPSFPASIQIALYVEFVGEPEHEYQIVVDLQIDDEKIASAPLRMKLFPPSFTANVVLPKGIVTFEKPSNFRVMISVDGDEKKELVTKKVILNESASTASRPPSSQSPPYAPTKA